MNKTKEVYRPMTLIYPLLYVDLVNLLTEKENWDLLINKSNAIETLKFSTGTIRFNITVGGYFAGEKNSLKLENELIIENGKIKI